MESYKEIKGYYSREGTADLSSYEKDHKMRLDFLIKDMGLDEIKNQKVCDFGAGGGYIFRSMDSSNEMFAIDGFSIEDELHRETYNLDLPFAKDFISKYGQIDIAFSFEMFEHLTNPYNFIYELKQILKEGGLLYFTVPHEETQHNTFYPGLIYPVNNLIQFFQQMSFRVIERKIHSKRFVQNVLVFENMSWEHIKMLWPKIEKKFHAQPPHVQVNL
jgi:2-polyprenyl-3-methyl-5-hydroxy-6-metoxy-1,4-benzoquinol methylase